MDYSKFMLTDDERDALEDEASWLEAHDQEQRSRSLGYAIRPSAASKVSRINDKRGIGISNNTASVCMEEQWGEEFELWFPR